MTTNTKSISFANGDFLVDLENPDFTVRAPQRLDDGDWKTASVKGWRYLLKDEEMVVTKTFVNAYGLFVSGKNPRGEQVDLEPRHLVYVERDHV